MRFRFCALWLLPGLMGLSPECRGAEPLPVTSVVISLINDVLVASQEGGIVRQVEVREGDRVESGQLLGGLDDVDARLERQRVLVELQIVQAEAESRLGIELAEKSLAVAEAEVRRAEQSNERYADTVSQSELDKLRFVRDEAGLQILHAKEKIRLAELRVLQKRTELDAADRRIARRQISAPLTGVVVQVHRQPGEWIQPGEPFCRIIQLDRLRAEGFVADGNPLPSPGQSVMVRLPRKSGELRMYPGSVTFVDPEINPISGQFRLWAQVENHDGLLRPGERPELLVLPVVNGASP